jgi:hypothetical protein
MTCAQAVSCNTLGWLSNIPLVSDFILMNLPHMTLETYSKFLSKSIECIDKFEKLHESAVSQTVLINFMLKLGYNYFLLSIM